MTHLETIEFNDEISIDLHGNENYISVMIRAPYGRGKRYHPEISFEPDAELESIKKLILIYVDMFKEGNGNSIEPAMKAWPFASSLNVQKSVFEEYKHSFENVDLLLTTANKFKKGE
jgi:hypothetical protein